MRKNRDRMSKQHGVARRKRPSTTAAVVLSSLNVQTLLAKGSMAGRLGAMSPTLLTGVALVAAVAVAFSIGLFDLSGGRFSPDSVRDWVVTRAALGGLDPYESVSELAERFGTEFIPVAPEELGSGRAVHPRLPGALLLQVPWALLPLPIAVFVSRVSALVGFAMVIVLALRLPERRTLSPILLLPLLVAHPFVGYSVAFGNSGAWLGALLVGALIMVRSDRPNIAGVFVGVASVLRAFPLLFLVLAWRRGHQRVVLSGIVTFVVLNVVALAVFDISLFRAVAALGTSGSAWLTYPWNLSFASWLARLVGSVAGFITVFAALVLTWLVARSRIDERAAWAVVGIVGLTLSPLSWDSYRSLLVLPLVLLWSSRRTAARVAVFVGTLAPYLVRPYGATAANVTQLVVESSLVGALLWLGTRHGGEAGPAGRAEWPGWKGPVAC